MPATPMKRPPLLGEAFFDDPLLQVVAPDEVTRGAGATGS
jgi:hypothetical protein